MKHFASCMAALCATTLATSAFALNLTSPAFRDGGAIPKQFTCDGSNVSPPLEWNGAPVNTRAFALIVDDPDAPSGTFAHWSIWNLPASTLSLPEGADPLPAQALEGKNGKGESGYFGPCPPSGTHHYRFTIFALKKPLGVSAGAAAKSAENAARSASLASVTLTGTYARGK